LIETFLGAGQDRTIKAKKNIVGLFLLRGIVTAVNFVLVPLTLHYLNPTRYGIWLTLTSIIGWVSFLDIGLGNGLRNKFAEALARNDEELARSYVSTTYAVIGGMMLLVILLFSLINPFLRWAAILNAPADMESELSSLALFVFTFFSLRLVFGLIGIILVAMQRPAMSSLLETMASMLTLVAVLLLTLWAPSSLLFLGIAISAIAAIVPFGANLWLFRRACRRFAPSFSRVDLSHARELVGLGVQFFVLQISSLVILSSANIIIAQLFGPAEVTPYNIAYKYYGAALLGFTIILTPFWSAYTDAYVRGDTDWIRRSTRTLIRYWIWLCGLLVVMTLASNTVYRLWVGKEIVVPFTLSALMALYVVIVAWGSIFVYFMNAIGKIRVLLYFSILVIVVNIPLSIVLAKPLGLNVVGVILGTCICLLPGCVLWPVQMRKILDKTATGIWGR
jgi:O-antigen/teichoic acid export membrane protein